jgi:hypothetical protein
MSRKLTTRTASSNDDKSLTHWRAQLENDKQYGHLEGSYQRAVKSIFNNYLKELKDVMARYPSLANNQKIYFVFRIRSGKEFLTDRVFHSSHYANNY